MAKHAANPVIVTSTEWADAGYDCDHCGGRILRRTDHETGLRDRALSKRAEEEIKNRREGKLEIKGGQREKKKI